MGQTPSPYPYAGNNPIIYVDKDGRLFFVPILVGAAIGAAVSGITYSVIAGERWTWRGFGKALGIGAVGGALGGGLGAVGTNLGAFGQSIGYNVLSNVASNSAVTLAFGGDITVGSLVGSAVGGYIGASMGGFNGVKGNWVKNAVAELGYSAYKGAITGGFGGAIAAAIDRRDPTEGFLQGAKNGAIAHGVTAGLTILTLGPTIVPDEEYGEFGKYKPVYRRGTPLWPKGSGMAVGGN